MISARYRKSQNAFTLIELLVVIAIIWRSGSTVASSRASCSWHGSAGDIVRAICDRLGLAIHQFANAHKGRFPLIAYHNSTETGETEEQKSWIARLAPYLESVDSVRLCPEDVARIEGLEDVATSYAMNGYLRKPESIDTSNLPPALAAEIQSRNEGLIGELYDLPQTHATILMFEGKASRLRIDYDHVHSYRWFSEENRTHKRVYEAVTNEVPIDRHTGKVANYLYADGHVKVVDSQQIAQWCEVGFNFAIPPQ